MVRIQRAETRWGGREVGYIEDSWEEMRNTVDSVKLCPPVAVHPEKRELEVQSSGECANSECAS